MTNETPTLADDQLRNKLKHLEVIVVMGDDKPYSVKVALPDDQVDAIMHLITQEQLALLDRLESTADDHYNGFGRVVKLEALQEERRSRL